MATVFWDKKRVLVVEFMPEGTTITSEVHCETLKKLLMIIQNERCGMLTYGVALLHDDVRPHTSACTLAFWSISAGSCLTAFLAALISLGAATICLPA
jgi:hypothetical protein